MDEQQNYPDWTNTGGPRQPADPADAPPDFTTTVNPFVPSDPDMPTSAPSPNTLSVNPFSQPAFGETSAPLPPGDPSAYPYTPDYPFFNTDAVPVKNKVPALILGILSLFCALLPFFRVTLAGLMLLALPFSIAGVIVASRARKGAPRGTAQMATAGCAMSVISLVISSLIFIVLIISIVFAL